MIMRMHSLLIGVGGIVAAMLAPAAVASADSWPRTQVKILVPYAAGGGTDAIARLFSAALNEEFQKTFIVVNRPGGKSQVAYQAAVAEPADGSTLLFDNSSHTLQELYKNLPYDPAKDFVPVSLVSVLSSILVVSPRLGVNTLEEFVAHVRAHPGKINCGSYGVGTISHLQEELLNRAAKIQMVHVPYKGSAPALNDLVGGHIDALFVDALAAQPLVKAGKVKALAAVGNHRAKAYSDLPTFAELNYPELGTPGWVGFFARAGTPQAVLDRLGEALKKIGAIPELAARLQDLGAEPYVSSPTEFADLIRKDAARWKDIVADRGIPIE
jgi:tripartite-type tricarboxylate transporter receptor subunit TctC